MRRALAFLIIILGLGATLRAQSDSASRREALLARAKALELSTPYVPPLASLSNITRLDTPRSCVRLCS